MLQGMGGNAEREVISKRHSLLTKLAAMRAGSSTEPDASDDKAAMLRSLERKRILIAKTLERKMTHEVSGAALQAWYATEI